MPRKWFTAEQIINKLREAEVKLFWELDVAQTACGLT